MKKEKPIEIIFVTEHEGFENIKELRPYPASEYMPQWFKDMPTEVKNTEADNSITDHIRKKIPNIPKNNEIIIEVLIFS